MRAEAITKALGGRWFGRNGIARCPAHSDRSPSLSIADGEASRLLLYCHAGCAYDDVYHAVREQLEGHFPKAEHVPIVDNTTSRAATSNAHRAGTIWNTSVSIEGTLAEDYLRSRSIMCDLPETLRFHSALRHPTECSLPAMTALVQRTDGNQLGLHRTFLGPHRPVKSRLQPSKAMLGPCKGGAVRLRTGNSGLIVCEGIETGLSLCGGTESDFAVWAALSTSGVKGLRLPEPRQFNASLVVAMDGDLPGRKAGSELAQRAAAAGWMVETVSAPEGLDFNDVARGKEA
ncbi:MAG: hypothetical protein CBC34_015820 [Hyphomicrobiaceae bacterium TMED74]|nr:hypothetical protein [Filomicrobium sp.]RPG38518.1 MAG: hypothetical protein CBC34_015820 [Hyphomicrobiaceae bacterium TMED74]